MLEGIASENGVRDKTAHDQGTFVIKLLFAFAESAP
jgi:hypothetical protein